MTTTKWLKHWLDRRNPFAQECSQERARFLRDLKDPKNTQKRVLLDILNISKDSLHWRGEKFDRIGSDQQSFRRTVPLMRYDDFIPMIDEEALTKGGVLTCSPVFRWLKTSGTTATPKCVPYTLHWLTKYRIPAIKIMWSTYLHYHPEILSHPYAVLDTQTVWESVSEFVHGVEHQAISNRHPQFNALDWDPPWYGAPWFGPETPTTHEGCMYRRIRYFVGKDLHFIAAINPSTLISLRDYVALQGERLVRDLFDGTLDGAYLGDENRQAAQHLETVLGKPDFSLKDLWPSLSLYSCWLTASARMYQGKLDATFPRVSKIPFMSCGTEGVVTLPVDDTPDSQPLAINQAFFEFVPATDALGEIIQQGKTVDTLLFDNIEPGRDYHVIMTQGNGLYRLATGDIYRVNDIVDGVPWIQFVRRDGIFHSFTGEKITEAQMTQALSQASQRLNVDMGLYLCGPRWCELPNYVVAVEAETWRIDHTIARCIDEELKKINVEYASKRDSARLGCIEVTTVPQGVVNAYVERKRQNGNATQFKYKPFHQNIEFLTELSGTLNDTGKFNGRRT